MRYKGFEIQPVPVFDYKPDPKSKSGQWKAFQVDIDYYEILDPLEGNARWLTGDSVRDCKDQIDKFLKENNMRNNKLDSWMKLDGFSMEEFNRIYPNAIIY